MPVYGHSGELTGPFKSLSAVTATGAGAAFALGAAKRTFGLQVTVTGAPTAAVVDLEGSLDGSTWDAIGTWSIGAGQASGDIVFVVDRPVLHVRANLTTLTGGTAPTVTAYICAV